MTDFLKMFQQAQEVQGRLQSMKQELEKLVVEGSSGGGMVTVQVDGQGQLRGIKLDASVVDPSDVEMLEDLIVAAVADGQKKGQEAAQEELGKVAGGLQLPFKLPF
jgi:hypothetical protein